MLNKDNIYGAYKLFTSQPLKALKYAKNLMVHCSPLSVISKRRKPQGDSNRLK